MDTENLARIFAPTLLRCNGALSSDPIKAFAEVSLQKTLLQHLINNSMKYSGAVDISTLQLSDKMKSRVMRGRGADCSSDSGEMVENGNSAAPILNELNDSTS